MVSEIQPGQTFSRCPPAHPDTMGENNTPTVLKVKIAISHLWHTMEPKNICHLIVKDKVAEQHILGKDSNCSSFRVTLDLLNSENLKVAITQLSNVQPI